jgi:spore coat protein U-like protein
MHKFIKATLIAGTMVAAGGANAATTTTTFPVTATVNSNCLVSATAMAFTPYTQTVAAVDQTSAISVRCSSGTTFNVGLNAGATTGATVTTRAMLNGTNQLAYSLFSNAGRTTNWGSTIGTDTMTGTGAGFAAGNVQTLTVYGRVPDTVANQGVPAGAYTDTVTVTVTW